jgi:tetratricopeptide (TPR) repeat protein
MNHIPIRVFWGASLAGSLVFLLLSTLPAPHILAQDDILGGKVAKSPQTEAKVKANIEYLEKQVRANPENYRFHFQLANAYVEGGDEENAKTSFETALRLNPKYVEALVNLGSLYSDLSQHGEAITHFEKALSLNPDDCKARSNLGNAYYALERYPDAMYEYRRAIEIDPKCYSALYNIAVAFADAGLFREAVRWWKKVERVAPGTEASRSAAENIEILKPFTRPPTPPGG